MRTKSLAAAILILNFSFIVVADNQSNPISRSKLNKHSFAVGQLKLTITRFRGSVLKLSRGYIEVKVENLSDRDAVYNPRHIALVDKDNNQVNIRGKVQQGFVNPQEDRLEIPQPISIAPGAKIREFYQLDGKVRLPARLFYEASELALITQ